MSYPKLQLSVIAECNDENDNPTCWSMIAGECKGHKMFVYVTKYDENEYIVEDSEGHNLNGKKAYKTLNGAKRKAEEICWRQNETGYFTN